MYLDVAREELHHVSFHLGEIVKVQAIALRPQKILLKIDHWLNLAVVGHDLAIDEQVERVVDECDGSLIMLAVPNESR